MSKSIPINSTLIEEIEVPEQRIEDIEAESQTAASSSKLVSGHIPIPEVFPPLAIAGYIDLSLYKIKGAGKTRINFNEQFDRTPALVKTVLGYMSIKIYNWSIRIPMPAFISGLSRKGFNVYTFGGTYYLSYIAIGK